MPRLQEYLEDLNTFRRLTGQPDLAIATLTEGEAQEVFESLSCDLSPENLCGDGEFPADKVRARFALFNGAWLELESLGFRQGARFSSE